MTQDIEIQVDVTLTADNRVVMDAFERQTDQLIDGAIVGNFSLEIGRAIKGFLEAMKGDE